MINKPQLEGHVVPEAQLEWRTQDNLARIRRERNKDNGEGI